MQQDGKDPILFRKVWKQDLIAGFLVFLIALPLCLGIALACGYPAISGVFTAIVGGLVATFISNSSLTIKGPAAGLIVIALGCINDFGFTAGQNPSADLAVYKMALAVGVAAGALQVILGMVRAGELSEFFPTSVVHGMLAAIGVIIIAKQLPVVIGTNAHGEPLEILWHLPHYFKNFNPEIALIGGISLALLFALPLINVKPLSMIPGPMLVVLVAVPLGIYFDLSHAHTYSFGRSVFVVNDQYLVNVPANLFSVITFPDFNALKHVHAWKWVFMFLMIGSVESLLSAKAIDLQDPYKRKTDMNKDLIAIGVGNVISACIGGLPMISEIVRSKANIDNGAKTRMANFFHGLFLLLFVATVPGLLHQIPLAALAAMLVYTGCRLASPREFQLVKHIGTEQLIIFTGTLLAVLATDLLVGVGIGILIKLAIHLWHGASLKSFFKPEFEIEDKEDVVTIKPKHDCVFCNWLPLKRQISKLSTTGQTRHVEIDFSDVSFIDHTVMSKLNELKHDFTSMRRSLTLKGLEKHQPLSSHQLAARRRVFKGVHYNTHYSSEESKTYHD